MKAITRLRGNSYTPFFEVVCGNSPCNEEIKTPLQANPQVVMKKVNSAKSVMGYISQHFPTGFP